MHLWCSYNSGSRNQCKDLFSAVCGIFLPFSDTLILPRNLLSALHPLFFFPADDKALSKTDLITAIRGMDCHFTLLRQWLKLIKVQAASLCCKYCATDQPAEEPGWRCWAPDHSSDARMVAAAFIFSWRHLTFASFHTSLSLLESWKCNVSTVNVLLSHTRTRNAISVWMMYEVNGSCAPPFVFRVWPWAVSSLLPSHSPSWI